MSEQGIAALLSRMDTMALPAAVIALGDGPAPTPTASAIGGPVWRPHGASWPDHRGRPMLFLAQINFAETPPLPDFPTSGLLQVFVADDDVFGCRFPSAPGQGFALDWWPEPVDGGQQAGPTPKRSPFRTPGLSEHGRAVGFTPASVLPSTEDWRLAQVLEPLWDSVDEEELEAALDEIAARHPIHHVGGHPEFTQYDIRSAKHHAAHDRTLLKLGCDDDIMWGDAGEACVLIPADDLRAHRFDSAIYSWDCH